MWVVQLDNMQNIVLKKYERLKYKIKKKPEAYPVVQTNHLNIFNKFLKTKILF